MTKNEAIGAVKSKIKYEGYQCGRDCTHRMCCGISSMCLLTNENIDEVVHIDSLRIRYERTETCKALFKED